MQLFSPIVEFNVFIQVIQLQYQICSDMFVLSWGLLGFFALFFILPCTLHYFFSHTLFEQIYLY